MKIVFFCSVPPNILSLSSISNKCVDKLRNVEKSCI
jgi:hypothetical protein